MKSPISFIAFSLAAAFVSLSPRVLAQTASEALSPLRGEITSVTKEKLVLATSTGPVTISVDASLKEYKREPSDLSKITDKTFVGITSVKTGDKEKATEIHIFPEELRGVGEGSHMMDEADSKVAQAKPKSRMSNGAVKLNRMTNGSVSKNHDSNLTVTFKGGEQVILIPKDVPVTILAVVPNTLKAGDKVFLLAKKNADGTFSSDKVITVNSL